MIDSALSAFVTEEGADIHNNEAERLAAGNQSVADDAVYSV